MKITACKKANPYVISDLRVSYEDSPLACHFNEYSLGLETFRRKRSIIMRSHWISVPHMSSERSFQLHIDIISLKNFAKWQSLNV